MSGAYHGPASGAYHCPLFNMKILYLSQRLRTHALTGGGMYDARAFQWLRERHDVFLIGDPAVQGAAMAGRSAPDASKGFEHSGQGRGGRGGRWLRALRDCLIGGVWSFCPDYDRRVEMALEREAARGGYDVIWADGYYCAPYLRRARGLPSILMTRDSQTRYHRLRRRIHPSLIGALNERRMAWFEKRFYPLASRVVFLSEQDAQFHRSMDSASRCVVFPAAVDTPSSEFRAPGSGFRVPSSELRILFTGAMDYEPNSDAVIWFSCEIMPLILREAPEAEFIVAGHSPGANIKALEKHGKIRVLGFVEDLRSLMSEAPVFVSPLRFGAGVKTKMLEAMAMGKAIAATPLSSDGIAARDGEEMLFAEKHDDFAQAVLRLLGDSSLRDRLGAAARQAALAHHTWERFFEAMERLLKETAQ
ncbi:MAG: glycosyltransferase [Candidatus Sumerlaeota bacterium]|nr:glycosyltransferase [Candidatus Sumerlaeota bacterium]